MTRMLIATIAIAATGLAMPAAAQEAEPPVNQVIVYGDQPCPTPTNEEIIVCVRQEDPYRIPTPLRQSESRENESYTQRVAADRDVGSTGPGTCNTVGPAGQTGCSAAEIQQAYEEKKNNSDVRFGQLIAEERAKRLSEIDESAALEQERVEALEAEYEARRKAEEAAAADAPGAEDSAPLPDPAAAN